MKNTQALIIIAKYPEKETVKTRLKGLMTDEKRLALYVSMFESTVNKLKSVPGVDTYIAYAPEGGRDYFKQFGVGLILLPEGDLGGRMFHAFREVFKPGYQRAALVGADIPGLSLTIMQKAFELLSCNDVVYGPAEDGGYYLVGMRKLIREIFEGVPWSSDQTLKMSIEKAEQSGFSVALLETLFDVDTMEDAKRAGLMP